MSETEALERPMAPPMYSLGDEVWVTSVERETKRNECPDCHGTGVWQAISAGGRGYTIPCPRCRSSYASDSNTKLEYIVWRHAVVKGVIDGVNIRHHKRNGVEHSEYEYSVRRGPIGCGTYSMKEHELHASEEEADLTVSWKTLWLNFGAMLTAIKSKQFLMDENIRLDISDYQLDMVNKATNEKKAWEAGYEKEAILNRIHDEMEWSDGDPKAVYEIAREILNEEGWLHDD
jgi:hypothetical protein